MVFQRLGAGYLRANEVASHRVSGRANSQNVHADIEIARDQVTGRVLNVQIVHAADGVVGRIADHHAVLVGHGIETLMVRTDVVALDRVEAGLGRCLVRK